jgi:hypothetical protein
MEDEQIESWPLICPNCDRPANGAIRGQAHWSGEEGSPIEWTMVQCNRCFEPALLVREDFGGGFDDDYPIVKYPAPPRLSSSVPHPLRREWQEAQTCLRAKAYAACTVMVRRTLEGTCADQGAQERTLVKSLKRLADEGKIDETLSEWAKALRVVGNRGAHYSDELVSREDAEDALAFAEALLDHIYVLRVRFEQFRSRIER